MVNPGQGQVVKIKLSLHGDDVVIRKMKNVRTAMGLVGTQMTTFNTAGQELSTVFTRNATLSERMNKGLMGLAVRFVGLNAAVNLAVNSMHKLLDWFGESTEKFRDFDKRIAEVSTILGGDALVHTNKLRIGIENLSKAYGKSANDLAEGTYQILSAAFDARDAVNLLNTATKASIAGLTDVATSVDVFTSILNSYGKTVAQATQVSDILFQTVVRGKLRFEDLASAMGYITPIAANAGVAFNEVAAALSTVTRMGLHVDMATRGLALGLQDIIDPTTAAAKAARQYEVDMSAVALRVKGFVDDLNEAMSEYGTSILPEMIRNMRSMRVFMALAGEEGVLGFAKDLELLAISSGKTEEALSRMLNTAQMRSDMLAQSMEFLERRIGEAWNEIDIWWRKAQLWWGTFLSGGDANKAIRDYEEHVWKIRKNYYEMMKATSAMTGQPSLFNQILGGSEGAIDTVRFDKLKEYFNISEQIDEIAEKGYILSTSLAEIDSEYSNFLASAQGTKDVGNWLNFVKNKANELGISIEKTNDWYITQSAAYDDLTDSINKTLNSYDSQIAILDESKTALELYVNYYTSAFDDATEAINTHIENIYELEYALKNLRRDVSDTYTTLGGHTFEGKLGYEKGLFEEETEYSRSQQYTNMAIKYGAEFINEYNEALEEAIMTVHNYKEANDELNQTMLSNNIKILALEIKGAESRRGLTRAQERQLDKLNIANMKARLEAMKNQKETESGYEDAQKIIDEYYDRWGMKIFELKDIRDDELRDMEADYDYKKGIVVEYTELLEGEYKKLSDSQQAYLTLLQSLDDEMVLEFHDTWGVDIPNEIQKSIDKIAEFQRRYNDFIELTGGIVETTNATENLYGIRKRDIEGHKTGSYYIPKTDIYKLHRGEQVVPSGGQRGSSGNIVINNHNTINANIGSRYDVEKLARDLAMLQSSGTVKNIQNEFVI